MDFGALLIPAAVIGVVALLSSLRVLYEYERGVVFRLGRLTRAKGPGLIFLVPFGIERMKKMDLRIVALDIPPQDTITKDNVSVKVNAVVYFRVAECRSGSPRRGRQVAQGVEPRTGFYNRLEKIHRNGEHRGGIVLRGDLHHRL